MMSARSLGWIVVGLSAGLGACSETGGAPRGAGESAREGAPAESMAAHVKLGALRERFVRQALRFDDLALHHRRPRSSQPVPVIGAGLASFERLASGRVHAQVGEGARRTVKKPARVELPARASERVRVEDETSKVAIGFSLVGAREAEIAMADGLALYEGARGSPAAEMPPPAEEARPRAAIEHSNWAPSCAICAAWTA